MKFEITIRYKVVCVTPPRETPAYVIYRRAVGMHSFDTPASSLKYSSIEKAMTRIESFIADEDTLAAKRLGGTVTLIRHVAGAEDAARETVITFEAL